MIVNTFSKNMQILQTHKKLDCFIWKIFLFHKYKTVMSVKGINKNDLPRQVVFIIVGCKII